MGPIDWLEQADRLAYDAAQQQSSEDINLTTKARKFYPSEPIIGSNKSTICNKKILKQNMTNSNNNNNMFKNDINHLLHSHIKSKCSHICRQNHRNNIKRSRSRRALDVAMNNCAIIILLVACLLPSQNLNSVESLRNNNNNNNNNADLVNSNSAADINNSIELKQQMELIRGASSVELGRSNVNVNLHGNGVGPSSSLQAASASSVIRAQRQSEFNGAPTCGYPGSPAHASVTFNTSNVVTGTAASYTCDNGYELLGPPRRICQANGSWSPVGIPFCGK